MNFSENRNPPRIKSGADFFGIILCWHAGNDGETTPWPSCEF